MIKHMKILFFILLFFLICSESFAKNKTNIELSLKSDKLSYKIGDEITLQCIFKNNEAKSIYLLPWNGLYTKNWLSVYNCKNDELLAFPTYLVDRKILPTIDDFILILPKEEFIYTIKGKIIKGKFSKLNQKTKKKYHGIFIDLNDSVIFLDNYNRLTLQAYYPSPMELISKQIQSKLLNIVNDNLFSNKLIIDIQN